MVPEMPVDMIGLVMAGLVGIVENFDKLGEGEVGLEKMIVIFEK